MPRTRKEAPEIDMDVVIGNERRRMTAEWEAREPEHMHVWKLLETSERELARAKLEQVRDSDGKIVQDDYQMLCRIPKDLWTQKRGAPEQRSLRQVKSITDEHGSPFIDDAFTKFRDPKVVPRKKE